MFLVPIPPVIIGNSFDSVMGGGRLGFAFSCFAFEVIWECGKFFMPKSIWSVNNALDDEDIERQKAEEAWETNKYKPSAAVELANVSTSLSPDAPSPNLVKNSITPGSPTARSETAEQKRLREEAEYIAEWNSKR
jgi:hypothetical protein